MIQEAVAWFGWSCIIARSWLADPPSDRHRSYRLPRSPFLSAVTFPAGNKRQLLVVGLLAQERKLVAARDVWTRRVALLA
jgi:hypothetical protein